MRSLPSFVCESEDGELVGPFETQHYAEMWIDETDGAYDDWRVKEVTPPYPVKP